MNNLFNDIPDDLPEEWFDTLVSTGPIRIERIVSRGQASPEEGWFDSDEHEFVVLLAGAARLEYPDGRTYRLQAGDWLEIPAHEKHRVAWTDPGADTVWLAVHYSAQ